MVVAKLLMNFFFVCSLFPPSMTLMATRAWLLLFCFLSDEMKKVCARILRCCCYFWFFFFASLLGFSLFFLFKRIGLLRSVRFGDFCKMSGNAGVNWNKYIDFTFTHSIRRQSIGLQLRSLTTDQQHWCFWLLNTHAPRLPYDWYLYTRIQWRRGNQ